MTYSIAIYFASQSMGRIEPPWIKLTHNKCVLIFDPSRSSHLNLNKKVVCGIQRFETSTRIGHYSLDRPGKFDKSSAMVLFLSNQS